MHSLKIGKASILWLGIALVSAAMPTSVYGDSSGTCFFVSPDGVAVTNAHVINGAGSIGLAYDGGVHPASVVSIDLSNDLVVLKSDVRPAHYLRLASDSSTVLGDSVFTIGFPATEILGNAPKFTNGVVSALSGLRGNASWMQITVPVQPGNSGGPLVNEGGEVVGVVVSTAGVARFIDYYGTLPQNVNWAIKSSYLRPMLEATIKSPPPAGAWNADRRQVIQDVQSAICQVLAYSRANALVARARNNVPSRKSPDPENRRSTPPVLQDALPVAELVFERPHYSDDLVNVKLVAIEGPDIRGISLPEVHKIELGEGKYSLTLQPWMTEKQYEEPRKVNLTVSAGRQYWITGQRLEGNDWKPILYKETDIDQPE